MIYFSKHTQNPRLKNHTCKLKQASVVLARLRACLKNHSCNLHAPLCGIFHPNSVVVARYDALIRAKSPTNCDAHLAESLFQTRSRFQESFSLCRISNSSPVYLISPYYMHNCKNLLTVVYCTHCCADTVTKRVTANFQSKYNGGFSWPHSFSHPYTS